MVWPTSCEGVVIGGNVRSYSCIGQPERSRFRLQTGCIFWTASVSESLQQSSQAPDIRSLWPVPKGAEGREIIIENQHNPDCIAIDLSCLFPQTDPKNFPQPPTAELRRFDPFLGKFSLSGEFANLPWTGTLELKKVIKGWYIEQIILVKTEGIDREFRILATWDKKVQKYRLWGFQTLPIMPDNGGEIRFEGDEMITEWPSVKPDGNQVTSSNCYRFVSKDELEIVSYRQIGNGAAEKIGFLKGKRMLNAEAASTSDHLPANSPAAENELRAAMAERQKAMLAGDSNAVERLMAEEYLQTDIMGRVQDKSAWLAEYFRPLAALIKAGKFRWEMYDEKDVQMRMLGDTAVVVGSLTLKGTGARPVERTWEASPQSSVGGTLHFTRVWINRNGRWLLAAVHNAGLLEQGNK
jgi:uncharacterized protein DUF4440